MYNLPKSAYIHIPFCHRRCFYCDFSVVPIGDEINNDDENGNLVIEEYLNFLKKEILSIKHKASLSTIYIGGGTPSILNPKQIRNLLKVFRNSYGIDHGAEITMEVDPSSFDKKDLCGFIDAGVNRFSLGVQSFNNEILKSAGRRHTAKEVEQSCDWLKKARNNGLIRSWSLDLIQNLPKSVLSQWEIDLEKTINYNPPHISIYDLSVEEGTVFQVLQDKGKLLLPNDDECFEISRLTKNMLNKSGYLRYEISNYSIPGHQSRHNRVYWKGFGWWSFGQGSTSAPWGIKFTRPSSIKEYKKWVLNQCESEIEESLVKSSNKYLDLDEKIMIGLRLREGVDLKRLFFEQGWNSEKSEQNFNKLLRFWSKYLDSQLLVKKGDRYFLSDPEGMDLSNQILVTMFRWWESIN